MAAIRAKSVDLGEFLISEWAEHLEPLGFDLASPIDPAHRGSHVSMAHSGAWPITRALIDIGNEVGIDGLARPSEIVVVSDANADPALIAADLIAHTEHDPEATPILVTTSSGMSERIETQVTTQPGGLISQFVGESFC